MVDPHADREHEETPSERDRVAELEAEIELLSRRLRESPKRVRNLEEHLLATKGQLAQAVAQNEKLSYTLREARDQITVLRDELDKLSRPPAAYGTLIELNADGTVDVMASGRKMRVEVSPGIDPAALLRGAEIVLNESFNVVGIREFDRSGEVVAVKQVDGDGERLVVVGRGDEERVVLIAAELRQTKLRTGDQVRLDPRAPVVVEVIPRGEVDDFLLEVVPDIDYADIGGLDSQIEAITDSVELPFLHRELFDEYGLPAPKGILLYGPPGCGKTMIAKAVAHSLAKKVSAATGRDTNSYFINIKGPELLNKYVGETERHIREVFRRARDKAADGTPVIVFFDEMESLFRTRGTGVSSDMESTIVPQLLAEIDGVEELNNVIVIGASNREDLIDPAILRPGRLDVKIKVQRPDRDAAAQIFDRYLHDGVPISSETIKADGGEDLEKARRSLVETATEEMYRTDQDNEFLEVTYQNGDKELLYFSDFASGAMIENIVRRAKQLAIKRELDSGMRGITAADMVTAVRQEFKEHEDLPNTTNPDDWARVSGRKGERIVFIRTLVHHEEDELTGGKSIDTITTGQYL